MTRLQFVKAGSGLGAQDLIIIRHINLIKPQILFFQQVFVFKAFPYSSLFLLDHYSYEKKCSPFKRGKGKDGSKMTKCVYTFGNGMADGGHKSQKNLFGGKGAGLAEMARVGLPVPAGLIITT